MLCVSSGVDRPEVKEARAIAGMGWICRCADFGTFSTSDRPHIKMFYIKKARNKNGPTHAAQTPNIRRRATPGIQHGVDLMGDDPKEEVFEVMATETTLNASL